MDDDNVLQFGVTEGGKKEDAFPKNSYCVTDIDGIEWYAEGFLVFTPHHVAIMASTDKGAIPSLVLPIGRVKAAEMFDDEQ